MLKLWQAATNKSMHGKHYTQRLIIEEYPVNYLKFNRSERAFGLSNSKMTPKKAP